MSADPAFAPSPGRIKRQVQGREHRFALVCPPGLEDVCRDEALALGLELCPGADGGAPESGPVLELTGRLEDLYRACLFLRTTSRVLVRLDHFRAGAREELFAKAANFPWELWLPAGCELRVDAHVHHSRISHEGMCADTLFEAVTRRMEQAGLSAPRRHSAPEAETVPAAAGQRLIIHLDDNHAIISLDASGEHLHRRGWRLVQGAAPIRENLAAGLLAWADWPAGYDTLVDGMTGSGTFAIEAVGLVKGCRTSGQASRDFAFRCWPSFAPARFEWLSRQHFGVLDPGRAASIKIMAQEIDPAVLALAQQNSQRFSGSDQAISWRQGDFFELAPPAITGKGLLVLNPPYGLRLSDGEGSLYPRLCRHLAERWQGWDIVLLGLPDTPLGALAGRLCDQRTLRHGGLRLQAWHFGPTAAPPRKKS